MAKLKNEILEIFLKQPMIEHMEIKLLLWGLVEYICGSLKTTTVQSHCGVI